MIHRYIDTMYDDTMPRVKYQYLSYNKVTFILALSIFSHVRLCITTNVCILLQSHVSGLDIRTARRHEASIKDARDCWRNSRTLCEKFPAHTSEAHTHTHTHTHTHLKRTHTDSHVNSARILNWALFCAWMNKFRQTYIKMHVLANILVNSRLRKACVWM